MAGNSPCERCERPRTCCECTPALFRETIGRLRGERDALAKHIDRVSAGWGLGSAEVIAAAGGSWVGTCDVCGDQISQADPPPLRVDHPCRLDCHGVLAWAPSRPLSFEVPT